MTPFELITNSIGRAMPYHRLSRGKRSLINPKALILVISAAGAYIAIAESIIDRAMIIVGVFFLAGVISCSLWMIAGDALNRLMSSGKYATYVNVGMGMLILLTALHILLG